MKLVVHATARTTASVEEAFDQLTSAGLTWIESPWSPGDLDKLEDGAVLTWSLGRRATVHTTTSVVRPTRISWRGQGLEGQIELNAEGEGTYVSFRGTFPLRNSGLTDLAFSFVMRGKMSSAASEETTRKLERLLQ